MQTAKIIALAARGPAAGISPENHSLPGGLPAFVTRAFPGFSGFPGETGEASHQVGKIHDINPVPPAVHWAKSVLKPGKNTLSMQVSAGQSNNPDHGKCP
ncbi:MAG: hypothetical protein Q7T70_02160 [Polaromonas sp.]|nr:hypothetical protein [Polaromonas sp.]